MQRHVCVNTVTVQAVQVFYPDADDVTAATCDPWHGEVADIMTHDGGTGEDGVQADPYGCGGLWERFMVGWQPNLQVKRPHHVCCMRPAVLRVCHATFVDLSEICSAWLLKCSSRFASGLCLHTCMLCTLCILLFCLFSTITQIHQPFARLT